MTEDMVQSTDCIFNSGYDIYNDNKVKIFGIVDVINHTNGGLITENNQHQVFLTKVITLPINISRIIDINAEWLLIDSLNNAIGKSENHKYFTPATMCYNGFSNKTVTYGLFVDSTFYNNIMKNTKDKGLYLTYSINALI